MTGVQVGFRMGRVAAYVACAALVIMAAVLVVTQHRETIPSEMLSSKVSKASAAHALKRERETDRAVAKIQKKMMQSLHIASPGQEPKVEDPTQVTRDSMLKKESSIASLKVSSSNLFARWEKERTIARDAQTKAVSLHELMEQDKTKERMDKQDLENLKSKLTSQLTARGGTGEPIKVSHKPGFSAESSRNDLTSYFAKLDKADKVGEHKSHVRVRKEAAKLEEKSVLVSQQAAKTVAHKDAQGLAISKEGARKGTAAAAHGGVKGSAQTAARQTAVRVTASQAKPEQKVAKAAGTKKPTAVVKAANAH